MSDPNLDGSHGLSTDLLVWRNKVMNLPIWQTKKNLVCSCDWTPIITYPKPTPPPPTPPPLTWKKKQQNKTHTLSLTYKICTSYLQVYQQFYCLLFHFQQVSENSFVTVQSSRGSYSVLHIEPKQGKIFFFYFGGNLRETFTSMHTLT